MGGHSKFHPVAEMVPAGGGLGRTVREAGYEPEAPPAYPGDPEERVDRLPMPYDAINYVLHTAILERVFDVVDGRAGERAAEALRKPRRDLGSLCVGASSGVRLPSGAEAAAAAAAGAGGGGKDKKAASAKKDANGKGAGDAGGAEAAAPLPGVRAAVATAACVAEGAGAAALVVVGRDDGCVALVDASTGATLGEFQGHACGLGAGPVRCLASVAAPSRAAGADADAGAGAGAGLVGVRAAYVAAASEGGVTLFAIDVFPAAASPEGGDDGGAASPVPATPPELRVVATSPAAVVGCGLPPLPASAMPLRPATEDGTPAPEYTEDELRQRPSDLALSADGSVLVVSGRDTAQFCVYAVPELPPPAGPAGSAPAGGKGKEGSKGAPALPELAVVVAPRDAETKELAVAWPAGFKTRVGVHFLPALTPSSSRARAIAVWWEGLNRVQIWPLPSSTSSPEAEVSAAAQAPDTDLVLPDMVTCVASSAGDGRFVAIGFAGAAVVLLDTRVGLLGLRPLGLRPRERPEARLTCLAFSSEASSARLVYALTDGTGGVADLHQRTTAPVPGSPALAPGVHAVRAVRRDADGVVLLERNDRSVEVVSLATLRSVGVLRAEAYDGVGGAGAAGLVAWRHDLTPSPPRDDEAEVEVEVEHRAEPEAESLTLSLSVLPAASLATAAAEAEAEADAGEDVGPSPRGGTHADADDARLAAGVDALRDERMRRGMALLAGLHPTAPKGSPFRPMGLAERWGGEGWDLWATAL